MEPVFLMSIRPQYVRPIFARVKRYELRKVSGAPRIEEGSIVVVYASGNLKSVIGEFRVGRVIEDSPEKVWALVYKPGTGVSRESWNYIRGARRAMALEIRDPVPYPRPVTLDEIRRVIPGWLPPFSYRELYAGDPFYELILRPVRSSIYKRVREAEAQDLAQEGNGRAERAS